MMQDLGYRMIQDLECRIQDTTKMMMMKMIS